MEEIRSIIKEYMEVILDPNTSDHAKVMAKIHAFDDIVEVLKYDVQ